MKIIYRIARLELARLFYSPIAWLLLVIFSLQSGLTFIMFIEYAESMQQAGQALTDLSSLLFSGSYNLWISVKGNLYLYIPLLTMGLLSKEMSSGSIKLLYSSPVKFRQIVFGKFLAMVAYISILMSILVLFTIAGGFAVEQLDYPYVLTGVLGLFLLCCAYASIGLFISSLTSYQIVAAIGTLAVLSFFNLIGNYGQGVPVLKDILYWLSINGRVDDFIRGMINSRDLLYLLLVIALFLALTIAKLNTEKKIYSQTFKIALYTGLTGLFIGLTYIASIPSLMLYLDTTATKKNTLTSKSQEIISVMNDPIQVTTYVNLFDPYTYRVTPKRQNSDKQTTRMYTRFLPHIEYSYKYFYDSIPGSQMLRANKGLSMKEVAQKMAKSHDVDFEEVLNPEAIQKEINLTTENNQMVRVLRYKDRTNFIRFYNDMQFYASENEITSTLQAILNKPSRVAVLRGNGERSIHSVADDGYQVPTIANRNRRALISKGFSFKEVTLNTPGDLLSDIDILVVSDPKEPLSPVVMANLEQYIDRGGNLLLACEPGSYSYLQPLMDKLGVQVLPGSLQQPHKDFPPDFILGKVHQSTLKMHKDFSRLVLDSYVSFPNALGLRFDEFGTFDSNPVVVAPIEKSHILKTHPDTGISDTLALDEPLPLMVALNRKQGDKEQRIIVSGDADFMSVIEVSRRNVSTHNSRITLPLFGWLANGEYPVDTSRPELKDTQYTLTERGLSGYRILFNGILPALILLSGMFLLLMRKRK